MQYNVFGSKHRSNVQGNDENSNSQASIVEVGNKHGNGDEFPDFADFFFFGIKNVRVRQSIGNTHIFLGGLIMKLFFLNVLQGS